MDHLPDTKSSIDCNTTLHTELETNEEDESRDNLDNDSSAWIMEDDCHVLIPHYLLIEQDPRLQHELAVQQSVTDDHSSIHTNDATSVSTPHNNHASSSSSSSSFQQSLQHLLEQRRRQLATSMHASRRTRQVLTSHIRQRAGLSNVLQQIERSSWTIQEHVVMQEENAPEEEDTTLDEQLPEPPAWMTSTATTGPPEDDAVSESMDLDEDDTHHHLQAIMAMDTTTAFAEDDFANSILNVPDDDDDDDACVV